MRDIDAYFEYTPGTAIAICGKLFNHAVNHWEGGERICYTHFMRNNILNRLQLEKVSWVNHTLKRPIPIDNGRPEPDTFPALMCEWVYNGPAGVIQKYG